MHDWENTSARIVFALYLAVAWKQPGNIRTRTEAIRPPRTDHRVNLPLRQHTAESLSISDGLDRDLLLGPQIHGWVMAASLIGSSLVPLEGVQRNAVLVLQQPTNPDRSRLAIFRHTDMLTLEVFWRFYSRPLVHKYISVAEHAQGEDRYRDNRKIPFLSSLERDIHRGRHFGDIEGPFFNHLSEYFRR